MLPLKNGEKSDAITSGEGEGEGEINCEHSVKKNCEIIQKYIVKKMELRNRNVCLSLLLQGKKKWGKE